MRRLNWKWWVAIAVAVIWFLSNLEFPGEKSDDPYFRTKRIELPEGSETVPLADRYADLKWIGPANCVASWRSLVADARTFLSESGPEQWWGLAAPLVLIAVLLLPLCKGGNLFYSLREVLRDLPHVDADDAETGKH